MLYANYQKMELNGRVFKTLVLWQKGDESLKKRILVFSMFMIMILSLVGCAKLVSTEYENVEVKITDVYYKPSYTTTTYNDVLKMPMVQSHPAVYRITVEYNNIEYTISDSDTYNKYKDKVEQTVVGTLRIRTYDDGTVKYDITRLE